MVVRLLDGGLDTIESVFPEFNRYEAKFIADLDHDERRDLARLLRRGHGDRRRGSSHRRVRPVVGTIRSVANDPRRDPMGEIVGVGLISHAPTIMFDEATRVEINDGKEISLVPGLMRLRDEVFDRLDPTRS